MLCTMVIGTIAFLKMVLKNILFSLSSLHFVESLAILSLVFANINGINFPWEIVRLIFSQKKAA